MAGKRDSLESEPDKGELRRQQVLNAAAECFRKEGFHGSSIARISQAAGMSPGHIYHYFANKEAIVEAIARREESEMAELLRKLEQDRAGGDLAARLSRQVADTVTRFSDPAHVGLFLELAAEAARNRAVRRILQRSDDTLIQEIVALAGRVGIPAGMDAADLQLRIKLISAMFNGLMVRGVVDPALDRQGLTRLINQVVRVLLSVIE
jgi:AcrR family transcriptional regulator